MGKTQVFEITVVYKNGVEKKFKVTDFTIRNGRYSWTVAPGERFAPLLLGVDQIAAIWQREA